MDYSIIIPNYNGAKFLPACLDSLLKAINNCPQTKFEIILVDNGSKDNSVDIFKNFFRNSILDTKYLILNTNQGFSPAVNKGVQQAKHDYIVLLNNDLTMNPDWFQLVSNAITCDSNPNTAVYTGTVLNKDGSLFESQGLDFNYIGKCSNISNGLPFLKSDICNLKSEFIWGASAAFTVYNKSIYNKVGKLDDDFFAYEEDVDLALRLHKLGHKTLYVPQAISYHLGSGTSSKMGNFRSRHDFKNWIYIIIKDYSLKEIFSNLPYIFIERLRNLSGLLKATVKSYGPKSIYIFPRDLILTILEVLVRLPSMLQKRHQFHNLLKLHQL